MLLVQNGRYLLLQHEGYVLQHDQFPKSVL
jgi:hypothetical protein